MTYNTQDIDTFLMLARDFGLKEREWKTLVTKAYTRLDKKSKVVIDRETDKIEFQLRGRNIGVNGSRELLAKLGIFLLK